MNMLNDRLSELAQLEKIRCYIDKRQEEKENRTFIIVLGAILGIILAAGAVFAYLTVSKKKEKKASSLYDDLDQYYDAEGEMNFSFEDEETEKSEETAEDAASSEEENTESEESEPVNE